MKVTRRRDSMSMGAFGVLVALALLAAAAVGLVWLYPRAFPLRIDGWQTQRSEAVEIALAAALDLGALPERPYISATLATRDALEIRLLELGERRTAGTQTFEHQLLQVWRVTIYERGAEVDEWSYLAEVGLSGKLLTLLQNTRRDFSSNEVPTQAEAISAAREFLELEGHSAAAFGTPNVRRVALDAYTSTTVRFPARSSRIGAGFEVGFAGSELRGMRSWYAEDAVASPSITAALQATTLSQTFHLVVIFLFVPFLAIFFVRRYHEGVVGTGNGVRVFVVVLACAALLLLLVVRGVADGSSMSNVTRQQMTWLVSVLMLIVYFPAVGALTLMGMSLGDSAARGVWRRRLASFDALLHGRWRNSTFAASSLRGTVAGAFLAVLLLGSAVLLGRLGVMAPYSFALGPWWPSAPFPGLALMLAMLIYSLVYCCFGLVLVLPLAVDRFGALFGGLSTAAFAAAVLFPPLNLVPMWISAPVALVTGGIVISLYLRYDLLVAFLATLVSAVCIGALPLILADDVALQIQGCLALLGVATPSLFSLRSIDTGPAYRYDYDDVPPHVRRIAERERQRVELETARRIQASILPRLPERVAGVEVAHHYVAATEVGGDFYDVMVLEDGRLAAAIGDVAGHGVSSGLIMAMVRSALAVQVRHEPAVDDVMEALNRVVWESADSRRLFTTFCYLILDPTSGELEWASAGHIYPYRVSADGRVEALDSTAYPLGVRQAAQVDGRRTNLEPGDLLLLCSDGLVESCRLGSDEPFGFERLEDSLRRHAGRSAQALLEALLHDLNRFVAAPAGSHAIAEDDLTILVLRLADG